MQLVENKRNYADRRKTLEEPRKEGLQYAEGVRRMGGSGLETVCVPRTWPDEGNVLYLYSPKS